MDRLRHLALLALSLCVPHGHAQQGDPNAAHPNQVVTIAGKGYTLAGLVTHLQEAKTFKHGIVLFPGYPGIMKLSEENGQPRFELRGNFLVRSRRNWLDEETLTVVVDAPSDQWATFYQAFRESPRYGADVGALHAARMNPQLARRVILTSSVIQPSRNGNGLSTVKWDELRTPLLWVHHEADPCSVTAYRDARRLAEKTRSPLVTVRGGGPGRGDPCEAFSAHGFVGMERETVLAMRSWVKSGVVPADVAR